MKNPQGWSFMSFDTYGSNLEFLDLIFFTKYLYHHLDPVAW